MKISLVTIYLILSSFALFAQDFSFGKIKDQDFSVPGIDSAAKAVVLREFGNARIEYAENKGGLVLRYYYHTRILILKKEGFDEGNFSVRLHGSGGSRETIESIKGLTFNLSNGKIVETALERKNIISEKITSEISATKIALPDIKEGSIIELRYTTMSPYLYNFQQWQFQDYIPKLYSEFVTEIPEICRYNVNLRSTKGLSKRNSEAYNTHISTQAGDVRGTKTTYVMENIPAFVKEAYMTSPINYISLLTFELASYSVPFGTTKNFTVTWQDVEKRLQESEYFGGELKKKNLFKDIIAQIITNEMDDLEKARSIYYHLTKNIKWNKSYGIYTDKGIKKALSEKNGNIGDINLALINALRSANLDANPLILSSRDRPFPSFTHPVLSDFNYVIAHLKIGEETYLLDASDENLPFGLIPFHCINFQGRLLADESSTWIPLVASISNIVSYRFNGAVDENGNLSGKLETQRSGYSAVNKRNEIKAVNSLEEYFEKTQENNTAFNMENNSIEHLENVDNTFVEVCDVKFSNFANKANNTLVFNPIFVGKTTKNPFNLDERTYPIDLGSTIDEIYELNIQLPEGYVLVDKPKNINMALPNRDARYYYIIKEAEDNTINIQVYSKINKAFFLPEQYLDLKEFFSRIIQSQKIDLKAVKI